MSGAECAVCGDAGHGLHFGVEACRACAAFFRRTVIGNRSYRCRFDCRCEIGVGARCSCRACRLNKCLSVGMDPSTVQMGRDRLERQGASTTTKESPATLSTPPLRKGKVEIVESSNQGRTTTDADSVLVSSPSSSFATVSQASSSFTPLLNEMLKGYKKYDTMRRTASNIALNSEEPIRKMLEGRLELREGNYADNVLALKRDFALVTEMINDHFWPAAGEISTETKVQHADEALNTYVFRDPDDTRFLLSPHHYTDYKSLENFFDVDSCKTDPKQMAEVFRPTLYQVNGLIAKSMRRMEPSEKEFIGLVGLLLWDESDVNIPNEDDANVVERAKLSIYDELYHVCCNHSPQRMSEAADRFGTLHNMVNFCRVRSGRELIIGVALYKPPRFKKMAQQVAENFSLANVSNIFEIDTFLHSLNPSAW